MYINTCIGSKLNNNDDAVDSTAAARTHIHRIAFGGVYQCENVVLQYKATATLSDR